MRHESLNSMAGPLSIATSVYESSHGLQHTIEQIQASQGDIYKLCRDLINDALEFADIGKSYPGDYTDLGRILGDLMKEFESIRENCAALIIQPGEGLLKRALKWCKRFYNADSVRKKIGKVHKQVRNAQQDFLAKNNLSMVLNVEVVKGSVLELLSDMHVLVLETERMGEQASKIFCVDQMTRKERKAALRKTLLDLAVATKDESLFLLGLKIRTLRTALQNGAPTLYKDSNVQRKHACSQEPDVPSDCIVRESDGTWRRQDALIETISLLSALHDPDSMALTDTPALVLFIRADNLSCSFRSLGLRKEALHLCSLAHDVIQTASKSNSESCRGYLAQSLLNLANCLGDAGKIEEALVASQKAVDAFRPLARTNPKAFNPGFGISLHNLSVYLCDLGKTDEALSALQEVVKFRRALAEKELEAFDPALADSLYNLSVHLSDLGKKDEALAAMQETVEMHRALVDVNPKTFKPVIASSLNALSNCLSDLGRTEDSLSVIQEAVEIRRALAMTNSDSCNFALARLLHNMSFKLGDAGKEEEALAVIQEAVEIQRQVSERYPDAFHPRRAYVLFGLRENIQANRRRTEEVQSVEEKVHQ